MQSKIDLLKQCIIELEAEKIKLKQKLDIKNNKLYKIIADFLFKISKLNVKIVDLKKNKIATTELKSENIEFRDRIMKVKQKQM